MCAIVGAMSFGDGGFKVTEPYITRMRDLMIHRGPDGAGTWISEDQRTRWWATSISCLNRYFTDRPDEREFVSDMLQSEIYPSSFALSKGSLVS